jgi:predicted DNA binding CopG/RHH family protein
MAKPVETKDFRLASRIPGRLATALKHRSADEGRTVQAIVNDAIERYLATPVKAVKR